MQVFACEQLTTEFFYMHEPNRQQCLNPLQKGVHTCNQRSNNLSEMVERQQKQQCAEIPSSLMGFNNSQTLAKFLSLPANERERILRLFGA